LGQRILHLENQIIGELTKEQIKEYEAIDKVRCKHLRVAENKCRKLRKGNVAFSDVIQQARIRVEGWSLLLKYSKGLKISARKLSRTMKKGELPAAAKRYSQTEIMDELKVATKRYYTLKQSDKQLRHTHLEKLAQAVASKGDHKKDVLLKQLRLREAQRNSAKKIKYLRGKLNRNSTTLVTYKDQGGNIIESSGKKDMEKTIIASNKRKFQLSFNTPFYLHPYNKLFGYKGLTPSSQKVLEGTFTPPSNASTHIKDFLTHVKMPDVIKNHQTTMDITLSSFISF
jgi:hypothetical protein